MKRLLAFSIFILMIALTTTTFAADEYKFELEYTGNIIAGEEKKANVILSGTNAPVYNTVRIKIDFVSGPATPQIFAIDSTGTEFDLTQLGYWGPDTGFQVGGTFSNVTPIKATYPKAGTYVTKLSLIDLANNNAAITEKEFTITVSENTPPPAENNTINNTIEENNLVNNNTIDEIPETGTSAFEYAIYAVMILATIFFVYKVMNRRNV